MGILDKAKGLLDRATERTPLSLLTVEELWIAYMLAKEASFRPSTVSTKSGYMAAVLKFLGGRRVVSLRLEDADAYRKWRVGQPTVCGEATQSTASYELKTLRGALLWAVKRRLIDRNPLDGMEIFGVSNQRTLTWQAHQVRRTGAAGNAQLEAIMDALYESGARSCEVIRNHIGNLQTAIVDDGCGKERIVNVLIIPEEISKTNRRRTVIVSAETAGKLRALPRSGTWLVESTRFPGKPVSRGTVRAWLVEAAADAGVTAEMGETPKMHATRHSFGTDAMRARVNPQAAMVSLGHTSLAQTGRYSHADLSDQVEAFDGIAELRARRIPPKRASEARVVETVKHRKQT